MLKGRYESILRGCGIRDFLVSSDCKRWHVNTIILDKDFDEEYFKESIVAELAREAEAYLIFNFIRDGETWFSYPAGSQ